MNYYVYLLYNPKSGELYKGYTINLRNRLQQHHGCSKGYTTKGDWKLIFCCVFPVKKSALDFEAYLKSGSGRAFIQRHLVDRSHEKDA